MTVVLLVLGIFAASVAFKVGRRPSFEAGTHVATPIASATPGTPGLFLGRVRSAGTLLRAPVSGRACVAFTIEIFQLERERHTLGQAIVHGELSEKVLGRRLAAYASSQEFLIEDASGRARVAPEGVTWGVVSDHSHDHDELLPPEVVELMEKSGVQPSERSPLSALLLGRMADGVQVREGVIEVGEFVEARGAGDWEPDTTIGASGGGLREAPRILALRRSTGLTFVTNDPTQFRAAMPTPVQS
jgi:hypothetical protein